MKRRVLVGGAVGLVVVVGLWVGLYVLMNSRTYQVAGTLVHRVDTADKVVALTFDDGPTERTPEIVAALAAQQVSATFYLVGRDVDAHPEYGKALVAAGHEIGNHSYTHRRLIFVSPHTVRDEVERTDAAIGRIGYRGTITFRPPYGKKLFGLPSYLSDHERTTVMWDVEPDSQGGASSDRIAADTLASVRPGSIILLHAMYQPNSLAAIPRIVSELRAQGYRFVTVGGLLAH
ncbi:polysaccharide deacetylase family protein [Nocardia transvalensis]|uniref:polysaccharide deacetylase family protein n=1 Tax=Nocardia transvalensis TaxID=37333 RepID=UPI001894F035|nr:polysaccharide deacetylase family protein [Nocardia transvalensis]MBF6327862.1 polysaccharide deacetylase family protein [Nocardia transvalensis]